MSEPQKEIKCVVWDLDNTLWDGVLLEDPNVMLKEGIGQLLAALDSRGILHSIASRNNHADAMKRLEQFGIAPFFLYPQIGWGAKSASVLAIQQRLNIGMDTIAFVDDDAFEREEVMTAHTEVMTVDAAVALSLKEHPRLMPQFVTEDSRRRRQMYLEDQRRNEDEERFDGPPERFLSTLAMKLIIHEAQEEDLQRAEELTVRTNQLNATGRTYSYEQLAHFMRSDDHLILIAELVDKYGSYGKIGLALIEKQPARWHLRLLLMSCRVQSRGVGSVVLSLILNQAKRAKVALQADFKETSRNRMMYVAYKFSNFREISNDGAGNLVLENDLTMIHPFPPYIDVCLSEGLR